MSTEAERLIRVETVVDELGDDIESLREDVRAIRESMAHMELAVARYKGFFGGVIFTVGAVAGVLGALVASIWHKLAS